MSDTESYLCNKGVLEPRGVDSGFRVATDFQSSWSDEIDRIGDAVSDPDTVAPVGVGDEYDITSSGDVQFLRVNGEYCVVWPSQAALKCDLASAALLDSIDDSWGSFSLEKRGLLLRSIRLYIKRCPVSGNDVDLMVERVETPAGVYREVTITSPSLDQTVFKRLFEA